MHILILLLLLAVGSADSDRSTGDSLYCMNVDSAMKTSLNMDKPGWLASYYALRDNVTVDSVTIKMRDGFKIDARVYSPPQSVEVISGVVYAHGGCFSFGDCESHALTARSIAALGIAVVDSSYRQGAENPHPAALNDLEDVTRHARELLWPNIPVGVGGSSSGGWFALALAANPPDDKPFPFALALCPVAHPSLRAEYLRSCVQQTAEKDGYSHCHSAEMAETMLRAQLGYFGSNAAMADASALLQSPGMYHNKPTRTLVILGGKDKNVPSNVTATVTSWATKSLVLGEYGHEIQMQPPDSEIDSYCPDLKRFVTMALNENIAQKSNAMQSQNADVDVEIEEQKLADGSIVYKASDGTIFDHDTLEEIGKWIQETNTLAKL